MNRLVIIILSIALLFCAAAGVWILKLDSGHRPSTKRR